jgi:opacity protein-like surface antigen
MIKTSALASALLLGALGVSAAQAAAPMGPYIGGSATQSRFDTDNFDVDDIDDEDTGWKAFTGWRFAPFFAVEGGYTNFGESDAPGDALGGPFSLDVKGISAFGVGILPLGPVELFGKAGGARLKANYSVGAQDFNDSSTEFAYGAGVQIAFGSVGLRAEYENFDTGGDAGHLDLISLGLTYTFNIGPR